MRSTMGSTWFLCFLVTVGLATATNRCWQPQDWDYCVSPNFKEYRCDYIIFHRTNCPYTCGLCEKYTEECGSKWCQVGGKLDLETCTCDCPSNWSGEECEDCPITDPIGCKHYSDGDCKRFYNVPIECPVKCGYCHDHCPGKLADYCKNGGSLNRDCTCSCAEGWTGDQCDKLTAGNCPVVDPAGCPQYGQAGCDRWANVPKECPIMCGICPDVCPGKYDTHCRHGGSLNSDCTCACTSDWTGDRCDKKYERCPGKNKNYCKHGGTLTDDCTCACTADRKGERCEGYVDCPKSHDGWICSDIPQSWCDDYSNIPEDCPYFCGLCDK